MTHRVFVTGLGVISGFGDELEAFWADCLAGRSVQEPIPHRWHEFCDYHSTLWSPLAPATNSDLFTRIERLQHDPATLNVVAAAHSALAHAGVGTEISDRKNNRYRIVHGDPHRSAAFVGTGIGGANSFMTSHAYQMLAAPAGELTSLHEGIDDKLLSDSLKQILAKMEHAVRFNPFAVSMLMPNAPAAYLGIKFGLRGGSTPCNYACASGTVAIAQAFEAVRDGRIDLALAGGTEYLDDPHGSIFRGFDSCGALVRECDPAGQANRPFDAARSGFLFSQGGAGVLVLESESAMLARGARPLAEILAGGSSFDAFSMMNPHPQGEAIERMLMEMLASANVSSEEVDYINAHGTGTQSNDACEAAVIARVFGARVAVNSTKSLLGHSIGASGALEAVVTALSLRDQRLHPSRNIDTPIENLDFVSSSDSRTVRYAITQSFAFGGHNAALLMTGAS